MIRNIAVVSTGATLRGALPVAPAGPVRALQAGDLPQWGTVSFASLPLADLSELPSRFDLCPGDVAFRCRGQFRAEHFVGGVGGRIVALAPLLILRVRDEAVLPGFLAFFLNAPRTRARMEAAARGSSIQFLGKAEVEEIEVPIPPLRQQRSAIEYAALAERERQLSTRLHGLRLEMMNAFVTSGSGDNHCPGRI